MMSLLAMRSRVRGPNLLVIMTRRPASGKLNLGGLELRISSTITTGFLPYGGFSFTVDTTPGEYSCPGDGHQVLGP